MSIETQLEELNQIKSDILTSIAAKGVTVPTNSGLKDCSALITGIPTGTVYTDLSGYNIALYTEFDSTAQINSSFSWHNSDECNALDFTKEVSFSFYVPNGYYSGGGNWSGPILTSYYNNSLGPAAMNFEIVSGELAFTFSLPSTKDLGGNPRARIFRQSIAYSFVEGIVSTIKVIGDTLIFNGVIYTIPNYSYVDLNARPQYFYTLNSVSFIQGFKFYGFDCGSSLRIRSAERLSDNAVCLVNLITGHDSVANAGGFILGPDNPLP